ncbi:MAG: CDP-diacylglycerol--serine O-phosphatidyltransferase, partial [Nitrospirae bacterium]
MCGALRLARYNVQMATAESKAFVGMPAPGAAIVVASYFLFHYEIWGDKPNNKYFVVALSFLLGLLMVSTIRYHGLRW